MTTNTAWYNYALASAGTITGDSNRTTAVQSICPKGWSLPTIKETSMLTGGSSSSVYVSTFSPVKGGNYRSGAIINVSTDGYWWGSEAHTDAAFYNLNYYNDMLYSNDYYRYSGTYIRCVSEEKDVSDLTYMQDMTPSILQELCVIVNVLRA